MRRFVSLLLTVATVTPIFVSVYEVGYGLNLKDRLANGTIEADVTRTQTYFGNLDMIRFSKNMTAVTEHVKTYDRELSR